MVRALQPPVATWFCADQAVAMRANIEKSPQAAGKILDRDSASGQFGGDPIAIGREVVGITGKLPLVRKEIR
jgi:hypothetical protein